MSITSGVSQINTDRVIRAGRTSNLYSPAWYEIFLLLPRAAGWMCWILQSISRPVRGHTNGLKRKSNLHFKGRITISSWAWKRNQCHMRWPYRLYIREKDLSSVKENIGPLRHGILFFKLPSWFLKSSSSDPSPSTRGQYRRCGANAKTTLPLLLGLCVLSLRNHTYLSKLLIQRSNTWWLKSHAWLVLSHARWHTCGQWENNI